MEGKGSGDALEHVGAGGFWWLVGVGEWVRFLERSEDNLYGFVSLLLSRKDSQGLDVIHCRIGRVEASRFCPFRSFTDLDPLGGGGESRSIEGGGREFRKFRRRACKFPLRPINLMEEKQNTCDESKVHFIAPHCIFRGEERCSICTSPVEMDGGD